MKKSLLLAVFTCRALCAFGAEAPREHEPLPNFDRRLAAPPAAETPAGAKRAQAAQALQARMRDVRVDRDPITKSPQWIASPHRFLTGPDGEGGAVQAATVAPLAKGDPQRAVKAFLNEHREIFGHDATALAGATLTRDDVSPSGLHTFVWQQAVNGVPVFAGVLKAGLTPRGELVNIGSHFVAAPREPALGAPRITAPRAVVLAAKEIGTVVDEAAVIAQDAPAGAPQRQKFEAPGLTDPRAELTLLPMDESTLRLCWSVILMSRARGEMYRVLVAADTGETQVRQCLTEYLSDASYRVFTSDSPTPMSPGLATPGPAQPPLVPRTLVTTPALNATASPNGWIDDGVNETRGNNVDAHTDLDNNDQPDLPRPQGSPYRVFDFPLDLSQAPGTYRDAAVTNLFYWCNRIHDRFYELGFTESAGNFQNDNFGRGGVGSDAILADAQDGGGTDNANFSSPPDGMPGRVQMYLWTGPTPARDGALDAEIMIHECTHGLSNRLVGGGAVLLARQARGMGEGWSDFYALCLLSEAGDDVDGNYAAAAYASYQLDPGYDQNYFFGIRRYPYSTDLTKNPLTFKDIDYSQASPHVGVPLNPGYTVSNDNPQEVHGMGEIWCNTLWQARANLVKKFDFPTGNDLILQLVTDGMKLSPADPNFLQARDAILQADLVAHAGANRKELWAAFAKRGMGFNATSGVSEIALGVVENFDVPDDLGITPATPLTLRGPLGGPFPPATQTYTFQNFGTADIVWTAAKTQSWVLLSATSGTLAPGAATDVTVTIDIAAAATFDIGGYADTVTFHDVTSGASIPRAVTLTIDPPRVYYFPLDSDPGWAREGEWAFGQPIGGGGGSLSYPDPASGATGVNVFGVNLAGNYTVQASGPYYLTTGAIDLSGRQNTRLRLQRWLNVGAFTDHATIDLSTDGITWTQIWKNVVATNVNDNAWTQVQYDISTLADNQPTVFIRWGYQTGLAAVDSAAGWNIDDIEFLGAPDNLTVTLPVSVTEGGAAAMGTVTANHPVPGDLTVYLAASDPARLSVPASVVIPAGATSAPFALAAIDDALLNGSETVSVTPSAPTWNGHARTTVVHDNETATLAVSLPATAPESAGKIAGLVTVSAPPASDVIVQLASSAPGDAVPSATATIPAGRTSAPFSLAIIENTRIDGPRNVTVSANVVNWVPGSAIITILDNENTNLTLTAPPGLQEGTINNGTVSISGTLPTALVITLVSDDTTELTVPASVTIPAGQTSASVPLTAVLDGQLDGAQTVHLSASAPGFVSASATIVVVDRDVDHFTFAPIASPQVRGVPFPVSITARDINDMPIGYTQIVPLSAAGDGGALPVDPVIVKGFAGAVWTGMVTVSGFAANAALTISDGHGHTGSSNTFAVGTGSLHHFSWDVIGSPQLTNTHFAATVRAMDAGGNAIFSPAGPANLSAALLATRPPTGTGTLALQDIFFPSHTAAREQALYLASELGGVGRLTALAMNVQTQPTGTFYNWTIRIKHTAKSSLSPTGAPAWETDGWTVVHVSDLKITNTGWVTFPFQTRFDYDGTSNLVVDFSWHGLSQPGNAIGKCFASDFLRRVQSFSSIMPNTDPLSWDNDNRFLPMNGNALPNLQFTTASPVAMQPTVTASFVNGVWTGNLSIPAPGAPLSVRADDGAGHVGDSGTFTVNPTDVDNDGLLDAWERRWWGTTVGHAALDDFDGDGIPELLEMAFDLDPTKPDSAALPPVVAEDGYLTITILKQPGVSYEVQTAGDVEPGSFSAGTTTVLVDDATTLKVRDNFLIGTPSARFLRVKVTAAP